MAYSPDKIRNIMIAGHSSNGKTSLAEALLYITKSSDRLGSVADGNTVTDFDAEEIKRKASISTAVAPFDYDGVHVNLIDIPGLFDFEGGMYEGVMAAESVLTVSLDTLRHVLTVPGFQAETTPFWPAACLHHYDLLFYRDHIRRNALDRAYHAESE